MISFAVKHVADADTGRILASRALGVAGGKDQAILFKKGRIVSSIPQDEIIAVLKQEIENF